MERRRLADILPISNAPFHAPFSGCLITLQTKNTSNHPHPKGSLKKQNRLVLRQTVFC
ncbi:hypothetical protein [Kingella oralis]|jgi:hypothetical protein|uniref:Uncharacterized protein n=2 Tax=Kingella TaxID=32257 RepID=C4GLY8_9NEIS|nr:hypothetical protein [Kingella oralis]EEP67139.1 hypothetical protein GCWU000324_02712 [Kingella oralis ATCC 51147]